MHSPDLKRMQEDSAQGHRRTVFAIFAAGLAVASSVLFGLDVGPLYGGWSVPGAACAVLALLATWRAWPR